MKKIDQLFIDFPELKIMEKWIRKELSSKSEHLITWIYKRYTLRKPKLLDKANNILKNSKNSYELIWADMYLNIYYSGTVLLGYMNVCFKELKEKEGFSGILKNLENPNQFFHTLSELEFNAYFANRYQIKIEPKIKSNGILKRLDSSMKLVKRDILFEITTPELYGPLRNSKKAIIIPNRSKAKFLDKLQRQIIPIKDSINTPLIIVINASYSDICEYDIRNALFGEFRFNMIRDKLTGKMITEYKDRDRNSLTDTEPLADYISAVIFYKRDIRYNGIFFSKEIIENKNPKFPLTAKEYKKLNRLNLRKISSSFPRPPSLTQ